MWQIVECAPIEEIINYAPLFPFIPHRKSHDEFSKSEKVSFKRQQSSLTIVIYHLLECIETPQ